MHFIFLYLKVPVFLGASWFFIILMLIDVALQLWSSLSLVKATEVVSRYFLLISKFLLFSVVKIVLKIYAYLLRELLLPSVCNALASGGTPLLFLLYRK